MCSILVIDSLSVALCVVSRGLIDYWVIRVVVAHLPHFPFKPVAECAPTSATLAQPDAGKEHDIPIHGARGESIDSVTQPASTFIVAEEHI